MPEKSLNHLFCTHSGVLTSPNMLIFKKKKKKKHVPEKRNLLGISVCKAHGFGCKLNEVHHAEIMKLFQELYVTFFENKRKKKRFWQQSREFPQSF